MSNLILELCQNIISKGKEGVGYPCYGVKCMSCPIHFVNRDDNLSCGERFEADLEVAKNYVWVNKQQKCFEDVVKTIKINESWESDKRIVKKNENGLCIYYKEHGKKTMKIFIKNEEKFRLVKKECNFYEAMESYENGKIVEDKDGARYRKTENGDVEFKVSESDIFVKCSSSFDIFSIDTINGKWYIID